jgi:hypothetical protein
MCRWHGSRSGSRHDVSDARPHANTYWVEPDRFLAGEYPGASTAVAAAAKLVRFLDAGIDTFIDLTEAHELEPYDALLQEEAHRRGLLVRYHRFPIRDVDVPRHMAEMTKILDTIADALAGGRRIYVHCWGGVGRTGTVVGCHLVRGGLDGDAALSKLGELFSAMDKASFRSSPETEAQRAWVRAWREPDCHSA